MAESLKWPLRSFREEFARIELLGLAQADWDARVLWIPRAVTYNPPASPNVVLSWSDAWHEIPECLLKVTAHGILKAFLEGFGEAFASAFRKSIGNQEQEQEQEQEFLLARGAGEGRLAAKLPITPEALTLVWNVRAPAYLPRVLHLTGKRREKVARVLRAHPEATAEFWDRVVAEYSRSRFLRGLNNGPGHEHFKADFDWLVCGTKDGCENFLRVLEGRYRDPLTQEEE